MIERRVIPCLLLKGEGFVKTRRFKDGKYLGDPRNIVRIFNDKEVDELVVLDIGASEIGSGPNFDLIGEIVDEAFVPVAYGGGISTIGQAEHILTLGVEKIVVNTAAHDDPELVQEAARRFGSQSVVVSMDVAHSPLRGHRVAIERGRVRTRWKPVDFARSVADQGAGELFLQSIARDGMMQGYDLSTIKAVSGAVDIPVVACGGAGSVADLAAAVHEAGAAAVAAGSLFVFHGPHRAVLINFPDHDTLKAAGLRSRFSMLSEHQP